MAYTKDVSQGNRRTKGKIRLKNLLTHSKGQDIFDIKNADAKSFFNACKKYGVLYVPLKPIGINQTGDIKVMVRVEDAAKVNRIIEELKLNAVKTASATKLDERVEAAIAKEREIAPKSNVDAVLDDLFQEEEKPENPTTAQTENQSTPSEPFSKNKRISETTSTDKLTATKITDQSIRDHIKEIEHSKGTNQTTNPISVHKKGIEKNATK